MATGRESRVPPAVLGGLADSPATWSCLYVCGGLVPFGWVSALLILMSRVLWPPSRKTVSHGDGMANAPKKMYRKSETAGSCLRWFGGFGGVLLAHNRQLPADSAPGRPVSGTLPPAGVSICSSSHEGGKYNSMRWITRLVRR